MQKREQIIKQIEYFLKIYRIPIIVALIAVLSTVIAVLFFQNNNYFTIFISITASLFIAAIIPLFIIKPTIKRDLDIRFNEAIIKLQEEIEFNYCSLEGIRQNVYNTGNKWLSGSFDWIPEKFPSIINGSNYSTHCFKLKAFEYFKNEGFVVTRDKQITDGELTQIYYFYIACINFSNKSQSIENYVSSLFKDLERINNTKDNITENETILNKNPLIIKDCAKDIINSPDIYFERICTTHKKLDNFLKRKY